MTDINFVSDNGDLKIKAQIPSRWDEMTAEQVCFVFRQYELCLQGRISPLQMNLLILYRFLNMSRRIPADRIAKESDICSNLYSLCEQCLGFLFEDEGSDGVLRITFDSVMNPLPVVRGGTARIPLTGPASLLQDLTFGEFRHASAALNTFFKSKDVADLNECIAFLYRPLAARPNRAGRKVKPVNPASFERDVKLVSTIPDWQKNLVMMWFSNCINYLQSGKLTLNGEDVDLKQLFSGDGRGPAFTWNDLLVQIARDNTIGNIDRVDEEPLFSVLAIMWTNHKETLRHEQQTKKSS